MDGQCAPIGVFDSGLGGLSVLRELRRELPAESFLYYADSGRAPYGPRGTDEVLDFSREITRFLLARGAKCIVVACNTATASAIRFLRQEFGVPFIGMEPAIKTAAARSRSGKVGVLATKGTLQGGHFHQTRELWAAGCEVLTAEADDLVTMAEQGTLDGSVVESYLGRLLSPMVEAGADEIVLGCTHYPFFTPVIRRLLPDSVDILDPAPAVSRQTARVLGEKGALCTGGSGTLRFFTTGTAASLEKLARITGIGNPEIELLAIPISRGGTH